MLPTSLSLQLLQTHQQVHTKKASLTFAEMARLMCQVLVKKRVQRTTVHSQVCVNNQDNSVQYPQPNIVEHTDHDATSEDEEMASIMGQQPNKSQAAGKSGKELPNPPTNIKPMKDTNI